MTFTLDNRRDLDLEAVYQVAWRGEPAALSDQARQRMGEARAAFLRLLDDPDIVIYGVTSGYGAQAKVRFNSEQRRRHAAQPPFSAATTFGQPLPERVTRTIVLARLVNYVEGHAAVTPALAQAVIDMLGGEPLPPVPMEGNGGAGEILALSQLFGPLSASIQLGEKEALALINGSPCAAALAADAAIAANRRLALIDEIFALAYDALQAPLDHLDPALDELWGDPAEAQSLCALRHLLQGANGPRRPYQAPVSFRILPRMLGRLRRALQQAEKAALTSLQSITDNPMFVPPDADHPNGRVLSNGGFHNTMAWPAMDELAAVYADLCTVAERHTAKILQGSVSLLPDQLRNAPDDPRYMGSLPMAQVGFGEEARRAAQRTFLPGSESGGFGQNDLATPHFFAWRAQERAAAMLEASLAALTLVASQAFYVTDRRPPPALAERLDQVRRLSPVLVDAIRPLGIEAAGVTQALRDEVFGGDAAT